MKQQLLFILLLVMLGSLQANGQDKFWKNVSVRKAYETKTSEDSKPAIFSYTAPKDTTASWLFSGGIGLDLFQWHWAKESNDRQLLTAFAVYNRNTLVAKKQKNYKMGLSMSSLFDFSNMSAAKGIFGESTVQYMHNYFDTTHSAILTSYWHPFCKSNKFLFLGGYGSTDHAMTYYVLPQAGLEYQQIVDANSKTKKGYDARFYFNIGLNIMIKKKTRFTTEQVKQDVTDSLAADSVWSKKSLSEAKKLVDSLVPKNTTRPMSKKQWEKLVEFSFSYTGRSSFLHYHSNFESYMPLFTAGVNIYPLKTDNFSFGLSYNNGANPIDGTLKQTFWLFSISFKK